MENPFFKTPLRGILTLVGILAIIFIILVLGHFASWFGVFGTSTPSPSPLSSNTPSPTSTQIPHGAYTTYVSAQGIIFNYMPKPYGTGPTYDVDETASKIYIYPVGQRPTIGQWVQIFQKDPNDTLTAAVQKTILAGYPSTCVVSPYTNNGGYPPNFQVVQIKSTDNTYPYGIVSDTNKCSAFARTNGMRYFLMDINHPDKFFYFDIGQYSIPGTSLDISWEMTIVITK